MVLIAARSEPIPGSVIASAVISSPVTIPGQPPLALGLVGEAQEVRQADVVVERDPEPEGADAEALALFADHEVEAEVIGTGAAVALGHRHRQEAAPAGGLEHLPGDDPLALPLAVAALLAEHLTLQERAEAGPQVFVEVLKQRPSHRPRSMHSQYWFETTSPGSWRTASPCRAASPAIHPKRCLTVPETREVSWRPTHSSPL